MPTTTLSHSRNYLSCGNCHAELAIPHGVTPVLGPCPICGKRMNSVLDAPESGPFTQGAVDEMGKFPRAPAQVLKGNQLRNHHKEGFQATKSIPRNESTPPPATPLWAKDLPEGYFPSLAARANALYGSRKLQTIHAVCFLVLAVGISGAVLFVKHRTDSSPAQPTHSVPSDASLAGPTEAAPVKVEIRRAIDPM